MAAAPPTSGLARLLRWENAGGTWRQESRGPSQASVVLCRCDGGEEVERFDSSEPELLDYLATAQQDDDL
jgi:hypothetical protein